MNNLTLIPVIMAGAFALGVAEKKLVKKNFSYGMQNAPCGETH